jgi:MFS family permease
MRTTAYRSHRFVSCHLLAASIATPTFGRLGDMFGKERFLAISLALFAAGSVVCAYADSLALMIVGRGLQGLGGILVDGPGYHWIFWVAAIMGVLATITTLRFMPASPVRTPGRVDLAGAGILTAGLTALLIGISRGADWGWGSAQTLGLLAGGLVVLALFGVFERRTPQPLVNMATFTRRAVLTTNISTVLIGSAMIGTFVLVPQLAQLPGDGAGFGLSATEAGLLLAPGSLVSLLVAPLVGRVGERHGSKPPFLAGCLLTALRCSASRSPTTPPGS